MKCKNNTLCSLKKKIDWNDDVFRSKHSFSTFRISRLFGSLDQLSIFDRAIRISALLAISTGSICWMICCKYFKSISLALTDGADELSLIKRIRTVNWAWTSNDVFTIDKQVFNFLFTESSRSGEPKRINKRVKSVYNHSFNSRL